MFFGFVCLCLSVFLKLVMSKIKLEPGDLCKPEYIQIFVKLNFCVEHFIITCGTLCERVFPFSSDFKFLANVFRYCLSVSVRVSKTSNVQNKIGARRFM